MRLITFCLLCFTLLFTSCDNRNIIYSEEKDFVDGWSYDNQLEYNFSIDDTEAAYEMVAKVSHVVEFPNQNLYTKIHTTYPDGKTESTVVSFELANNFGQWNGDCSRNECTAEILLKSKALFKNPGNYKIALEQYSRKELLEGILSIEFELIKLPAS